MKSKTAGGTDGIAGVGLPEILSYPVGRYHTGDSCVASTVYQFPQIVDNRFGPQAGIGLRLRATRPHPGLPIRSRNGASDTPLPLLTEC